MQYIYRTYHDAVCIHRKTLHGFDSLYVFEILIGDEEPYYAVSNLAGILGYRNTGSLCDLLKGTEFLLNMDDLYRSYVLDAIDFGNEQEAFKSFVHTLSNMVDDISMKFTTRSRFTNEAGLLFILAHNTLTSDRIKRSLCSALKIDKKIVCPSRPETHFCDCLSEMLKEFGLSIERQKQIGNYRVDMTVTDQDGKLLCAVEYDEPTHRWYDESMEKTRTDYLNRRGIFVIRASKDTSPASILKEIMDMQNMF